MRFGYFTAVCSISGVWRHFDDRMRDTRFVLPINYLPCSSLQEASICLDNANSCAFVPCAVITRSNTCRSRQGDDRRREAGAGPAWPLSPMHPSWLDSCYSAATTGVDRQSSVHPLSVIP